MLHPLTLPQNKGLALISKHGLVNDSVQQVDVSVAGYTTGMGIIDRAEARRKAALSSIDGENQVALSQYFTPYQAALILAELPRIPENSFIRILDPGAGSGMLAAALVNRVRMERPDVTIALTAVEIDKNQHGLLGETLKDIESLGGVTTELLGEDFVSWALRTEQRFDFVIQNPPYSKLSTNSQTQKMLREAGIDVPNIYAAFLTLGVLLLDNGGQQVAITPRSWMNGTYYYRFRRNLVENVGIDAIHTFESRSKVFGDTGVLQEAVIVSVTRGVTSDAVRVFTSHDHRAETTVRLVAYGDVVTEDFIHVPATDEDEKAVQWMNRYARYSLTDLGLQVSTGKVVDFRSRHMLYNEPVEGGWPIVNASHIRQGQVNHPLGAKKPEWFYTDAHTASKLLVPAGTFVLIKRFSAKEERRRIVAGAWSSNEAAAFDNKLNYVHQNGVGLDPQITRGLTVYLNSTQVDSYFRVFSGHTQVNATDLRQMKFPSLEQLAALSLVDVTSQEEIDNGVERVMAAAEVLV